MICLPKFRASPELEKFLKAKAGPHYVCDDIKCSIETLEGLQSFKALHGDSFPTAAIPVFPYAEDSPFSRTGDAAYQAYHDRLHAVGGYQFDIAGEYRLACFHYWDAIDAGLSDRDGMTLFHHVACRVLYHYYHDGQDPPCRATFISACFAIGGRRAARGEYLVQYFDYCG